MTDLGSLSPRARAALASLGTDEDLQVRTTIRRDDVEVLTSWLPVHRYYESMLKAPTAVLVAMRARHVAATVAYDTRAEAEAGHAALCARVTEVLRGLPEGHP